MSALLRRRSAAGGVVLAVLLALAASPARAYTFVYTSIPSWNLSTITSTYGGGTQFHISTTGDGSVQYRWTDVTDHDNDISGASCSDYSSFGDHFYLAGVTDYRTLFSSFSGLCFVLRGYVTSGAMYGYSGELKR